MVDKYNTKLVMPDVYPDKRFPINKDYENSVKTKKIEVYVPYLEFDTKKVSISRCM